MHRFGRTLLLVGCLLALASHGPAGADGGGGSTPAKRTDPDFGRAEQALKNENYARAIDLLSGVVARDPGHADAHNLLGFAQRHSGNLQAAFAHYERALALDPEHRGAHEYIGEAYLMAGDLAKAEAHLARLDRLCFFSCKEFRDLREAIDAYRARPPQ